MLTIFATVALAASSVLGHAVVQTPAPRTAGSVHKALCGTGVSAVLARDIAGPIEVAVAAADSGYDCNAYACRGYQYEDNASKLKVYSPGEVVTFHVNLVAGHRPGHANVSVIDPVANVQIGTPLKTWARWPVDNPGPDRDDLDFSVTIPDTLSERCTQGGACAIQWYWYAEGNKQTYESCVDFVVGA